jgi:hypothetical protein
MKGEIAVGDLFQELFDPGSGGSGHRSLSNCLSRFLA